MSFSSSYPFTRGAAVVVNAGCGYNKDRRQWEPEGPLVDEFERLTALLPNRHFEIVKSLNAPSKPTATDVVKMFDDLAATDFSKYDALLVVLMSHGREGEMTAWPTVEVPTARTNVNLRRDVYSKFQLPAPDAAAGLPTKASETLQGKPKIFIVEMCRVKSDASAAHRLRIVLSNVVLAAKRDGESETFLRLADGNVEIGRTTLQRAAEGETLRVPKFTAHGASSGLVLELWAQDSSHPEKLISALELGPILSGTAAGQVVDAPLLTADGTKAGTASFGYELHQVDKVTHPLGWAERPSGLVGLDGLSTLKRRVEDGKPLPAGLSIVPEIYERDAAILTRYHDFLFAWSTVPFNPSGVRSEWKARNGATLQASLVLFLSTFRELLAAQPACPVHELLTQANAKAVDKGHPQCADLESYSAALEPQSSC